MKVDRVVVKKYRSARKASQEIGLVWGWELYFDATKVEANAGILSLVPRSYNGAKAHLADLLASELVEEGEQRTAVTDDLRGSRWAATCWVSGRSTRRRSRSLAVRARTWGSFRGSKASACRLAFA